MRYEEMVREGGRKGKRMEEIEKLAERNIEQQQGGIINLSTRLTQK